MSILDRLFGTKKTPPTAEPTQRPAVPAEQSRPQSATKTVQHLSRALASPPRKDRRKYF